MIEEIFEMIMKEARTRKGLSLEIHTMMVLFEVTDKVCDAIKTLKLDRIKTPRQTLRRKEL